MHMRGLRIGFGLGMGLFAGLLGISLGQCSFYLPERAICTDTTCKPSSDMAVLPPDMAKDPNDPSVNGSYSGAPIGIIPASGVSEWLLLAPSDDGTTISTRQPTFPLVLMASPKGVPIAPMRPYADRLVSHGFFVGMYFASDQTYDPNYRDTSLDFLDGLLGTPPPVSDHIDRTKIGLIGYELSAKIHVAVANARTMPLISAVFMIDPVDLLSPSPRIDGPTAMAQLRLPNNHPVVMLGEPLSVMEPNPCIAKPQKSYIDFYNAAQSPVVAITFGGANLADFMTGYPDAACAAGSTAPPAQTQALAIKYATAYMQWTLKGSARAREYIVGADYATDAQTASLSQLMK
jgi:hypothetical protein